MTVGKIYAGLLILENWRAYKLSQSKMNHRPKLPRQPSLFRRIMGAVRNSSSRASNTSLCSVPDAEMLEAGNMIPPHARGEHYGGFPNVHQDGYPSRNENMQRHPSNLSIDKIGGPGRGFVAGGRGRRGGRGGGPPFPPGGPPAGGFSPMTPQLGHDSLLNQFYMNGEYSVSTHSFVKDKFGPMRGHLVPGMGPRGGLMGVPPHPSHPSMQRRRGLGRGGSGDRLPGLKGAPPAGGFQPPGGNAPTGFPSPSGDYPGGAIPPGGPHAPPPGFHGGRGGRGHNSLPRPPGPRRRQVMRSNSHDRPLLRRHLLPSSRSPSPTPPLTPLEERRMKPSDMYDGFPRGRGGPGVFSSDKSRSPSNSPPPTIRRGQMASAQRRLPPTPNKPSTLGVVGAAAPRGAGGGRGGPPPPHGRGGLTVGPPMGRGGIMPKSPSASHLISGPNAAHPQQHPASVAATSLMNLPKVNASPSTHVLERLQRSGVGVIGAGDVGTPGGGRALPVPPGHAGGLAGGLTGAASQGVVATPGAVGPRNLPPIPGGGAAAAALINQQQQTPYNAVQPRVNGTLPNGFAAQQQQHHQSDAYGKSATLPGAHPGIHHHHEAPLPGAHPGAAPFGHHPHPGVVGGHVISSPSGGLPGRDVLATLNRSDSDSETEWC